MTDPSPSEEPGKQSHQWDPRTSESGPACAVSGYFRNFPKYNALPPFKIFSFCFLPSENLSLGVCFINLNKKKHMYHYCLPKNKRYGNGPQETVAGSVRAWMQTTPSEAMGTRGGGGGLTG